VGFADAACDDGESDGVLRCVTAAAAGDACGELAGLWQCSASWRTWIARRGCGGGAGGRVRRGVVAGGSALLCAPGAARRRHRRGLPQPPELAARRQRQAAPPGAHGSHDSVYVMLGFARELLVGCQNSAF
jgi:hypothetical protein